VKADGEGKGGCEEGKGKFPSAKGIQKERRKAIKKKTSPFLKKGTGPKRQKLL